jgi:predicted ATPase
LSDAESERLLDNLLGESDLPDSVRDYIVSTAEGNPLFVEELLATLVDREILQRHEGRWTTTQVPAIPLPSTIQALVAARIDRLPEPERMVLDLGSVEGKVFRRHVVAGLAADMHEAEVDACLVALVRKELVREREGDAERFEFRHRLVREAAYESMTLQLRAELHERLARLLAEFGPSEPDKLVDQHTDLARRYRLALGERGD